MKIAISTEINTVYERLTKTLYISLQNLVLNKVLVSLTQLWAGCVLLNDHMNYKNIWEQTFKMFFIRSLFTNLLEEEGNWVTVLKSHQLWIDIILKKRKLHLSSLYWTQFCFSLCSWPSLNGEDREILSMFLLGLSTISTYV